MKYSEEQILKDVERMKKLLKEQKYCGPYAGWIGHGDKGTTLFGIDKNGKPFHVDYDVDGYEIETWWYPSEMLKESLKDE